MSVAPGVEQRVRTGALVGESAARPDGVAKVQGSFGYSSDLWAEGMLWGHTVRSPFPSAGIDGVDISAALALPGVHAVLVADDVPGCPTFGLDDPDQPVLATGAVRYQGEAVAVVAADHPETARRAAAAVVVGWVPAEPQCDPEAAVRRGDVFRHVRVEHGDPGARGPVVVEGNYELGMQDQAPLGTESGLALPGDDGGVELYVSTQFLHVDRSQVAACLGLAEEKVRINLAGVGGAFGAREDLSLQVHLCMLALHTGRPVKMQYDRAESFLGHVHRHPARIWMRHSADRDGRLVSVEARIVLDGGAYASTSGPVCVNATTMAAGPYRVPNALLEGWSTRTNNPPCGAMRGFGAVQACFGYEAQMDRLAEALGMGPVELRLLNALREGDTLPTGSGTTGPTPVEACIRRCTELPLPPPADALDPAMSRPGGAGLTADPGRVRRGVGFAVCIKNLMFSAGHDDYAVARVRLHDGVATVTSACAEVGQGFVTVAQQITRTVLGVDDVVLAPADTQIGSAGSTSASRQTMMSGGAVEGAARRVRRQVIERVAAERGVDAAVLDTRDGRIVSLDGSVDVAIAQASALPLEAEFTLHHRPTADLDERGQGDVHVDFAYAAHRAVVDVDLDLGLVKVVQVATAQDVGRALNPLQVVGQIEGGIAQGVGFAVMEEVIVDNGRVRNASFTDYLLPTTLDMPDVVVALIEEADPQGPFGAKGVGEPPVISSVAAVAAAIRAASGRPVTRVPVRPQDVV